MGARTGRVSVKRRRRSARGSTSGVPESRSSGSRTPCGIRIALAQIRTAAPALRALRRSSRTDGHRNQAHRRRRHQRDRQHDGNGAEERGRFTGRGGEKHEGGQQGGQHRAHRQLRPREHASTIPEGRAAPTLLQPHPDAAARGSIHCADGRVNDRRGRAYPGALRRHRRIRRYPVRRRPLPRRRRSTARTRSAGSGRCRGWTRRWGSARSRRGR